ncbi:hypothetical protein K2173_013953 [Erythroxylum novogranatense]|uniref:Ankyrin-3 n=1 Tax=Erythroxylum novogranatense TaxID=1862640 RepID=A0AAV8SDA2_9ROSI|nr:hypothetical protein K2173_013953 [Erythroxylum novogranatense]
MTVFSSKQVVPVDYEGEVSQLLLDSILAGDLATSLQCVADPFVDVNFVGAVCLKSRKSEVVLRGELPCEVRFDFEEFKTDVTALFLAVHGGHVALVKRLLSIGADVNHKLFRGFAATAAVRESHHEILEILLKAGASQPACEDALLEASCYGQARSAELLLGADLVRPHVAVHALLTASCRGFVDVVDTLIKCGVDINATGRLLLLSSKPSLHTSVHCNALVAGVVSRQVAVVRMLLKGGARIDVDVRLGAWSWDTCTGEEFRVGAGLAEPYAITWCAVEFFEVTGTILRMLLQRVSPNTLHYGRTLLHHAILCGNVGAVKVLLSSYADMECPIKTLKTKSRPIHMAARLGLSGVLQCLIDSGCDLNSRTESGDTALMICGKQKHGECLRILAKEGADFGLVNAAGQSASSLAVSSRWNLGFQQTVLDVIRTGKIPKSSNISVFSSLILTAQAGDVEATNALLTWGDINLDYQDDNGFSAVMFAALKGHVDVFRVLVHAGADVKLHNKAGESAIKLSEVNQNHDMFEKVMLEFALERGNQNAGGFYALHCAARRGDLDAVKLLTRRDYDVNVPDGSGYSPLMLAAREGHRAMCELLISQGANCEFRNTRGETAVSLAKKNNGVGNDAEAVILDKLARDLVLRGSHVQKHTKGGKGAPHEKQIVMVADTGVLKWGTSNKRNVVCRKAELGPSPAFQRNRKNTGDADLPGMFHVLTTRNKELHFVCDGGCEAAELWIRGIRLVTKEAICGK